MSETRVVGVDVWWDNKLQKFRKKRLNLKKVPLSCRCPKCGKILEPSRTCAGYRDITEPTSTMIELSLYGGVCYNCYLDGFGKYGERGQALKAEFKADEIKFKKNNDKTPLWINGKLRLTKGVIEVNI